MSVFENIALNMNIANPTASGTPKGAGSIGNAKNEAVRDMAMKLLAALEKGGNTEEIKALVKDLLSNQVTLTLPDLSEITGRTDTTLPINIGDTGTFNLTMSPDGKVTVSLVSADTAGPRGEVNDNPLVKKALASGNIPVNARSQQVAGELLNAGQSLSAPNIRKFIALSAKYPDIPVKELVLLDANKVPMTPANLRAFTAIAGGEAVWEEAPVVSEGQKEASQTTTTTSQPLPEAPVAPEAQKEASQTTTTTSNPLPEAPVAPEAQKEASQTTTTTSNPLPEAPVASEVQKEASQTKVTTSQPLPEAPVASEAQKEASQATTATTTTTPAPIEPKDFSRENVQEFYTKLKEAGETPAPERNTSVKYEEDLKTAAETEKAIQQSAEKAAGNVQTTDTGSKLQFMQDINNVFPFIQIPIKLADENAKGELYVYEKKKAYNPDEPLTAVLHLELSSLGTTDIKVSLFKKNVSAVFQVSDASSVDFFKAEVPELAQRLEKIGFTFTSDFKVKDNDTAEKPLLYEFLEAHSPKNYSRYTFDIHA